jgi:hypothetical protein
VPQRAYASEHMPLAEWLFVFKIIIIIIIIIIVYILLLLKEEKQSLLAMKTTNVVLRDAAHGFFQSIIYFELSQSSMVQAWM